MALNGGGFPEMSLAEGTFELAEAFVTTIVVALVMQAVLAFENL